MSSETVEIINKISTVDIAPRSLEYLLSNEEIDEEIYNILYEITLSHYNMTMNETNMIIDIKLLNIDEISKIKEKLNKYSIDDLLKCRSYYNEILNEVYDRCINMRYLNEMNNNSHNGNNFSSGSSELSKNSKWNNNIISINEKFPSLPSSSDNSLPIIPKMTKTTNNPYLDGLVSVHNKAKPKMESIEDKLDNAMKQLNEEKNNNNGGDNNKKNKKKKSKGILLTSY